MTLVILFSSKTKRSLENGLQPQSGVTPLFSIRAILLASLHSSRSVDADAQCKRVLMMQPKKSAADSVIHIFCPPPHPTRVTGSATKNYGKNISLNLSVWTWAHLTDIQLTPVVRDQACIERRKYGCQIRNSVEWGWSFLMSIFITSTTA